MAIQFNASRGATLGVEWELQLVDAETMRLRQDAREVLAALPRLSETQGNPKIRHELMESTVEVVTDICHTVAEARADLAATIAQLRPVADARGTDARLRRHPSDQRLARRGDGAGPALCRAGRADAVAGPPHPDLRRARPRRRPRRRQGHTRSSTRWPRYLPHFLALTASSPFWSGHDTGLASSRSIVFGALPTAGPPHLLADWAEFEDYMDTLLRAGTIRSIKEVWWDIRPHPDFGTIEIRMFDGIPTLREVGMVAALCQSLVELFDHQLDRGYTLPSPAAWVVRDNKWRATRYGLDATDHHRRPGRDGAAARRAVRTGAPSWSPSRTGSAARRT